VPFPLEVQRQSDEAEDLVPPGWVGVSGGVDELTDQPSDVLAIEQARCGEAFVSTVKPAAHREGDAEADHLALLLDLKQLGVDRVTKTLPARLIRRSSSAIPLSALSP
jgi:hypothetical protein